MDHMALVDMAYTSGVQPNHPVTVGVSGVWYPTTQVFQAAYTGPLLPDSNWTVLLRGSGTKPRRFRSRFVHEHDDEFSKTGSGQTQENSTIPVFSTATTTTHPVNLSEADSSGVPPPCINTTCKGRVPGVSAPVRFKRLLASFCY